MILVPVESLEVAVCLYWFQRRVKTLQFQCRTLLLRNVWNLVSYKQLENQCEREAIQQHGWHVKSYGSQSIGITCSKAHVHIHIKYPPRTSISQLVKRMKGRSSKLLQQDFPVLRKKYWRQAFLGDWLWSLEYRQYNWWDVSAYLYFSLLISHDCGLKCAVVDLCRSRRNACLWGHGQRIKKWEFKFKKTRAD